MKKGLFHVLLKDAAKNLWKMRDNFVEDGDYNVVLECLMIISDVESEDTLYSKKDCIAALDEAYEEVVG